jgi:hypothetical protein
MANSALISAGIAQAILLALTNTQMVQLCDLAIAGFMAGNGAQSYSIAGRSLAFFSLEQARAMRDYYTNAPSAGDSSFIVQRCEF